VIGHPTITALSKAQGPLLGRLGNAVQTPSYLDPKTFSSAVLDVIAPAELDPAKVGQIQAVIAAMPNAPASRRSTRTRLAALADQAADDVGGRAARQLRLAVDALPDGDDKRELLALLPPANALDQVVESVSLLPADHPLRKVVSRAVAVGADDVDKVRAEIEQWFNTSMDRVSGWYKRTVQRWVVIYAIVIVAIFNVDTTAVAVTLWRDPVARAVAVQKATATRSDESSSAAEALPVGWTHDRLEAANPKAHFKGFALKILGMVLSILAISLGAPFWFDTMSKLSRLRSTGVKPEEDRGDRRGTS
jgi:hypothetical protein